MLHPQRSAQYVLLCDHCEKLPQQKHCELCKIGLCKACAKKHFLDSKIHPVVPFAERKSKTKYAKCPTHAHKHCKHYCESCDIFVCSTCALFGKHKGHDMSDISTEIESLQQDLQELETRIYPRYEEMASDIQKEKAELETNYEKLETAADLQGEILHREVTAIVNQRKSAIQEMKNKHLSTLDKKTEEMTQKITELKQIIFDLKSMLKSNDISLTSTYKSRNSEFRTLPLKVRVTFPNYSPQKINKSLLNEVFGCLPSLSVNTEHVETLTSPEAASSPPIKPMKLSKSVSSPPIKQIISPENVSSPPVKPMMSSEAALLPPIEQLLEEPLLTVIMDTGYDELYSVNCLGEEQVWTCGNNKAMKYRNIQGKRLASIRTKSGNDPWDITLTRDEDLVYTDNINRTVNLVENKHNIRTVITLKGWRPLNICSTASDDLLVIMVSDDEKQSKVVRYSGSTETQTIQFDDQGHPLYSYAGYISENRNLDICVADWKAEAVVVVNQSGKLRFTYPFFDIEESFKPRGITTDSQSHILTSDYDNDRIHILDQDGLLLWFIYNLDRPYGLCVDIRDNLFVAECRTAKVKKIQYLSSQS